MEALIARDDLCIWAGKGVQRITAEYKGKSMKVLRAVLATLDNTLLSQASLPATRNSPDHGFGRQAALVVEIQHKGPLIPQGCDVF